MAEELSLDPETMKALRASALKYAEPFPLIAYPVKGGGWWLLHDGPFEELCADYTDVDVAYEVRVAYAWLVANPERQKTTRGMKRFLNAWLSRSREKARRVPWQG